VAALTRLGYDIDEHDDGTLITAVVAGSPAAAHLTVGQTVQDVDGTPTPNACAFSLALSAYTAGESVQLTVERTTITTSATLRPGKTVVEDVRLARWPGSEPRPTTATCTSGSTTDRGFLGVEGTTHETYDYPFPIGIHNTKIGGPSAGLAMTLAIIDTLSSGRLTGGKTVAATGTIAATGAVGTVGGVPQKTVAVEHAGATVFFVPAKQVATARQKATPGLRVFGVRTLTQALAELEKLGGTVPPPGGS
jgi:PDZ domain-containing protein